LGFQTLSHAVFSNGSACPVTIRKHKEISTMARHWVDLQSWACVHEEDGYRLQTWRTTSLESCCL